MDRIVRPFVYTIEYSDADEPVTLAVMKATSPCVVQILAANAILTRLSVFLLRASGIIFGYRTAAALVLFGPVDSTSDAAVDGPA
jgi:hypothetical protein